MTKAVTQSLSIRIALEGGKMNRRLSRSTAPHAVRTRAVKYAVILGMLLLPAFGPNELVQFSPAAATTMAPGLGDQHWYGFGSHQLTDRMTLKVNVANGNLVLETSDLKIAGTGLDLSIGRTYNSLSGNSTDLGTSWTLNDGADVYLTVQTNGDADFQGPSGYVETFTKNLDGSFTSPAGINATLVENAGGGYTLTFHKNSEQYNFDSAGVFTSDVDQNGNTISFAYDTGGVLATITDTQGRVVTVASSGGLISSLTDVASRAVTYTYSGSDLTGYTDANGETTSYAYNSHLLTQMTDPNGNVTNIDYDANNHDVVYNFDSLGRVTSRHYSGMSGMSTTYTANNDVASVTNGSVTNYSYDANNNLTSVVVPVGTSSLSTSFSYTDSARPYYPTSQTDPQGNTLAYSYDTNGNLVSTVDDLSTDNTYSYTYNSDGTLDTITDAMGGVTTYGYDSSGNLTSVTPPSPLGQTTIVPDTLSRVASRTDGKGQVTTYTYDDLDRITHILYNNGSTEDYTFDADGNQTQLVDGDTTTYTYDALNRMTMKAVASDPNDHPISDSYDGLGNITSETQGLQTYTYDYDTKDRLSTVTDPGGSQITYSYTGADWVTQMAYPLSAVTTSFTYDNAGRITRVQSPTDTFSYSYTDSAGNATALRQSETDGYNATHYTYDALNRLTAASGAQNYTYTYDGNGNRLSKAGYGGYGSATYTYNAANEMTAAGSTTYFYDANGNETGNSAGLSITYNSRNQTSRIRPAGSYQQTAVGFRGVGQGEMVADGSVALRGNRLGIGQADHFSGSTTTYFEHDSDGAVLGEHIQETGCYVWSLCQYYYTFDGRGNVQSVVGAAGVVGARYTYDPYGNITSTTGGPYGAAPTDNPFKFGGAYGATSVDNTGLVKIGERFYDPSIGRWTQADPSSYQTAIGTRPDVDALSTSTLFPSGVKNWKPSAPTCSLSHPQSLNYYTYANDDPINNVDPSGLGITNCMLDILGFGIAVVALFAPATTFWAIVALVGYLTAAQALMECIEKETPRYWGGNQ